MLPHMVGEFVVLLFLKLPVVERFRCFRQFTGKRFEQKVDKLRIVENAVNVLFQAAAAAQGVCDDPLQLPVDRAELVGRFPMFPCRLSPEVRKQRLFP